MPRLKKDISKDRAKVDKAATAEAMLELLQEFIVAEERHLLDCLEKSPIQDLADRQSYYKALKRFTTHLKKAITDGSIADNRIIAAMED